jgi:hypothetical protein
MPLMRPLLLALLALCAGAPLRGESQAAAGVNSYSNSSGLNVFTPELRWKADMDPRTEAALDFSVDAVSAASFNYGNLSRTHRLDPARRPGSCATCHPPTDALTGATKSYKEERRGFGVSLSRRLGDERGVQVKASYHNNTENDYSSNAYQAGVSVDFNDANTTLGLEASLLNDYIFPVISDFTDSLNTVGVDLTLTQVLTPLTVAELDYGFARAEGYQTNPYAFIEIGNDSTHPVSANQPREKQRSTASLRLKQGLLPGLASELGYRYYEDDWGVQGHTVDASLSQAIGNFVLEPHVRLYFQPQGAYFFQNFYNSAQTYMTRDLKLAPHQTSLLGVTLRGKLSENFGTELNYSHYTRQDSLDYSRYFSDGPENADLYQLIFTYE